MEIAFAYRSFSILCFFFVIDLLCCYGFQQLNQPIRRDFNRGKTTSLSSLTVDEDTISEGSMTKDGVPPRGFLIHWRGEKDSGYSKPFRQLEFQNALIAELAASSYSKRESGSIIQFRNALNYNGNESMTDANIEHFNEAMQFLTFSLGDSISPSTLKETIIRAAKRCSLVHALYEVIASGERLDDLANLAMRDGGFSDLYKGEENENSTWCFRARVYSASEFREDDKGRGKRYSSRTRSMKIEKDGLRALKDLLIKFGGKVDLENPDCKIYIFDGLQDVIDGELDTRKILARRIAVGPKTSSIAPAERICITNTPLEPIAAFVLCNIAQIKSNDKILDPYAGSCTTLLAASMIAKCETVGIEIAHNGLVNREDIAKDFSSRNLRLPNQIINGDSTDVEVREIAKLAVNGSFDAIIADPPYGIRESTSYNELSPLEELFTSISSDANDADRQRLIKRGGKLVAFVPVTDEQDLEEMLPSEDLTEKAGLEFELSREQPLNEKLSRWLVSYICVK